MEKITRVDATLASRLCAGGNVYFPSQAMRYVGINQLRGQSEDSVTNGS